MTPFFSVIIPSYNHAHYIGRAIGSVLNQIYQDFEIIVVDNHSEDNTDEIISKFSDSRIQVLKIRNNGIIAASRNKGILAAKGEWVAFLDSDDFWYDDKLKTVFSRIGENANIDVVCHDEVVYNENDSSRKVVLYGPYWPDFYLQLLLMGNCLSTSATVVRRSFLSQKKILFRENRDFITVEDYDLWMLLARANAKFFFVHSVLGEYIIHSNNSSNQVERQNNNTISVLKDHLFNLESFDRDISVLWPKIKARLIYEGVINFDSKKKHRSYILANVNAFFVSPVGVVNYHIFKLRKFFLFRSLKSGEL